MSAGRPGLRAATAAVCLALAGAAAPLCAESLSIAIVLSRDLAPYREAVRGFEEVLRESGRPYRLHEFSAEGLLAQRGTLSERIRVKEPDLILTVGSTATNQVSEEIRDRPIVFSMVLPAAGHSSLEELRRSRPNLTGTSMDIPVRTQFEKLKQVLPEARRIGVMYDPDVSGALIEEAAATARELDLELVPLPVRSETDVLSRTRTLGHNVDVLWSVADSTVFSEQGLKHILLATLRNRTPFVGLSPSFVRAGALLAFTTDYRDLGRQAGEQCLRVLAGEDVALIPIGVPRDLSLTINMNTARQIDVDIDETIRLDAELHY